MLTSTAPPSTSRRARWLVQIVLAFQGLTLAANGVAAPWIMRSFGLDQTGIAHLFGWISLSALGAFLLARQADRVGRARVLLWAVSVEPVMAIGVALAPTPLIFAVCNIVLQSAAGAAIACAIVWTADRAPRGEHATRQAGAGLAILLGSGPCVVLMPILARTSFSWRALSALPVAIAVLLPWIRTELRAVTAANGETGVAARAESTVPASHAATVVWPILASTILSTTATASVDSWRYFHLVTVSGLSPSVASALLLTAGGAAVAGFPLGAFASDRIGRVPAVALFLVAMSTAIAASFWGPPAGAPHPWLWLGVGFTATALAGNAITVAANTALTEIFPAHVRATFYGSLYLAGALGRVISQALVALLAPLGVSTVVGGLALLGIPSAALFAWRVRPIESIAIDDDREHAGKAWARFVASTVAILLSLAGAETFVRVVSPRALMVPWQDDIHGVTAPLPEVGGRFRIPDRFDTTVTIHDRFRSDHAIARMAPAGTQRIAVLGDSCTFGWGANDNETYPAVLERRLRRRAPAQPSVDVINAGVIGTGTGEQALWYDVWVRQFNPDIVVLSVFWNDVSDDLRGGFFEADAHGTVAPRSYEVLERALGPVRTVRVAAHRVPAFDWLSQRSQLLTWIRQAPTELFVTAHARAVGDAAPADTPQVPSAERLAVTVSEIEWLHRRLTSGARLAVVFIPSAEAFDPTRRAAATVVDTSRAIVKVLSRRLPAIDVPFLDLTPALARAGGSRLYFARDPHPNPTGYAAIGEAAAEFLSQMPR